MNDARRMNHQEKGGQPGRERQPIVPDHECYQQSLVAPLVTLQANANRLRETAEVVNSPACYVVVEV
jgi:hypothetical protein